GPTPRASRTNDCAVSGAPGVELPCPVPSAHSRPETDSGGRACTGMVATGGVDGPSAWATAAAVSANHAARRIPSIMEAGRSAVELAGASVGGGGDLGEQVLGGGVAGVDPVLGEVVVEQ